MKYITAALLLAAVARSAFASINVVPEVDPSTAAGALTLISGAALPSPPGRTLQLTTRAAAFPDSDREEGCRVHPPLQGCGRLQPVG